MFSKIFSEIIRVFLYLFITCSIAYLLVSSIMPRHQVFMSPYKMLGYHHLFPFQYIALVTAVFSTTLVSFYKLIKNIIGWKLNISILALIILSVFIASVPGGILWTFHDMQAGFFPKGSAFCEDVMEGAYAGLRLGWEIVGLSVPYNLICYSFGTL